MSRRKPTPVQTDILTRIQDGQDVFRPAAGQQSSSVLQFGWAQNGDHIVAHRTVATESEFVGRTELFRISLDGVPTQH